MTTAGTSASTTSTTMSSQVKETMSVEEQQRFALLMAQQSASTASPLSSEAQETMTPSDQLRLLQWLNQQKAMNELYGFTQTPMQPVSQPAQVVQPVLPPVSQSFVPQVPSQGMFQHYVPVSSATATFPSPVQTAPAPDPSWLAAVATMFRSTLESCGLKLPSNTEVDSNNNSDDHNDGPPKKKPRQDAIDIEFSDAGREEIQTWERDADDDGEEEATTFTRPSDKDIHIYREKIKLVRDLEDLETVETELDNSGGLSVDPVKKKVKVTLPASMGFFDYFDDYNKLLRGDKVVKGVQKSRTELGTYPKMFEPHPSYYSIDDCPWQSQGLHLGANLLHKDDGFYRWGAAPQIRCEEILIRKLESNERKCLNVASYTDHFIYGCKLQLKKVQDKLLAVEKDQDLPFEEVMNIFQMNDQILGLLDSAGKGTQNQANALVQRISQLVAMRRDAWMKGMDTNLPKEEKFRMRALSVNTCQLFPQEEINKAKEKVKSEKEDKVNDKLLNAQLNASSQNRSNDKSEYTVLVLISFIGSNDVIELH